MTQPKTLKDIELEKEWSEKVFDAEGIYISPHRLKQEAIKWIKDLEKEIEQIKKIPEVYQEFKKNPILIRGEVCHTIRWIKHFFNINGEELR